MSQRRVDPKRIEVVEETVAEVFRRKTPAERIAIGFAANRTLRLVIEGAIRSDHPDWTDEAVKAAVARRMLHGTT